MRTQQLIWYKVTEKMPTPGQMVLVVLDKEPLRIALDSWESDFGWFRYKRVREWAEI